MAEFEFVSFVREDVFSPSFDVCFRPEIDVEKPVHKTQESDHVTGQHDELNVPRSHHEPGKSKAIIT